MAEEEDQGEALRVATANLIDATEEMTALEEFFATVHATEWTRLQELNRGLSGLQNKFKELVRLGKATTTIMGHKVTVSVPKTSKVHTFALLERAKDRGDLPLLMEYGVVVYDVKPVQIGRLPGALKAIYSAFVEQVEETPRVTLPPEFR